MSIITTINEHIGYIQINRSSRKNALTRDMYQAMAQALKHYDDHDDVRVILIHGLPDVFCAGNDLNDFLQAPTMGNDSPVVQFLLALRDLQKPLIMAVNGMAIGIGVTMLLHADFVVIADDAQFQLPFVNLGLCPEAGSSLLLAQRAGYLRAAEQLMFGEFFTAIQALEMGVASCIKPAQTVLAYAQERAVVLSKKSSQAMRVTKSLLKSANADALRTAIDAELLSFAHLLNADDAKEAMTAFMEKRAPKFS